MDMTRDAVVKAMNRAADEVCAMKWDGCSSDGADAANLVVNAGLTYLENPAATLTEVIIENYGDSTGEFLLDLLAETE